MKKIIVFFLLCFNYAVVGQEMPANEFEKLIDKVKVFVVEKAENKKDIKIEELTSISVGSRTQMVLDELEKIKVSKKTEYMNYSFFEELAVNSEFSDLKKFFSKNTRTVEYYNFINNHFNSNVEIDRNDEYVVDNDTDSLNENEIEEEIITNKFQRGNKNESNILLYLLMGLTIVGLVGLLYFLYKLNEQKKSLKKDVDRLRDERNYYKDYFTNQYNEVNNTINKLAHENKLLKKDNEEFQRKLNEQHYKTMPTTVIENTVEIPKTEPVLKKYFGLPSLEGYFRTSVETKENHSSYKFTIDNSNQKKALFELYNLDTANVYNYISDLNSYINPACDKVNAPSDQTQNIEIMEPGIVYLEGDVWKIEKKCKIKFI